MLVIFMLNRNNCKIGYIRYNDRKYERFKDKIANIFRRIFIKVIIENIDNGIIILIPKYKFIKSTNKFVRKRIINQIKKYIKYENMQYIILDKDLSFIEENFRFIKEEFNKINILNGKYLMKNIISKLLEYIYNVNNKNIKLENIYIFVPSSVILSLTAPYNVKKYLRPVRHAADTANVRRLFHRCAPPLTGQAPAAHP